MAKRWDLAEATAHPTRALAQFVAETDYDDLPPKVVHEVKRLVLDIIGCVMGGYVTDIGRVAVDMARYLGGDPQATIIGGGNRVSCLNAAHANARMGNALDADDTFLSISHHGSPTVSTTLAVAETEGLSGKELITAVAVGFDVGARLGISTGPPFNPKTKEISSGRIGGMPTLAFASTAAAAKAFGLNEEQIANAFGIAGVESNLGWISQRREHVIHDHKRGYAADTGVTAALLAQRGLTADTEVLDGEYGVWRLTTAQSCNFELMVGGLGEKWYVLDTTHKPWPSCRFTHHPLTALAKILKEHDPRPENIEKVILRTHRVAHKPRFRNQEPEGMVNCEFSLPHTAAMLILGITPGPCWYEPEVLRDARVQKIRRRVIIESEPASLNVAEYAVDGQLRQVPAGAEVVCGSKTYTAFTEYAKGDPWSKETYFTDEDLKEKFRNMARPLAMASQGWHRRIEEIINTVFNLERIDDINSLTSLLAP